MSTRGDIIRGAGGHLSRNNQLGVGMGAPTGGDEGDIRVQMVDGSPKLYAKAGGQWYGINLQTTTSAGGVTDEFIIGSSADHIKITPESGLEVISSYTNVSKLGKTLRIGKVADDTSRLEVDASGNLAIINRQGTTDTTKVSITNAGVATFAGSLTATGGTIGNWSIDSTSIYTGTEDHSGYTANAGDMTIYSDGSDASIHAKEFYIDATGQFYSTNGNLGSGTSFSGSTWNGNAISTALQTSGSDNTNFYQDGIPTSLKAGDLWFDTDANHKWYRAAAAGATAIEAGGWVPGVNNADHITAGTLDCSGITVNSIDAGSITVGNLSATRISGGTLTIGNISFSGSISASYTDATTNSSDAHLLALSNATGTLGAGNGGTGLSSTSTLLNSNVSINTDGTLNNAGGGTPALQNIGGAITAGQVNCTNIALSGKIIITSTGTNNVMMGTWGTDPDVSGVTHNVVLGTEAGRSMASGANANVIIGWNAGYYLTDADKNVFIGKFAGHYSTTGYDNTFIGFEAGKSTNATKLTGDANTGLGKDSLTLLSTGENNTAIGRGSLALCTEGTFNTGLGSAAGDAITTGTHNTCLGWAADVSGATVIGQTVIGPGVTGDDEAWYDGSTAGKYTTAIGGAGGIYLKGGIATDSAGFNSACILSLDTNNESVVDGDVLGVIQFRAPNEGGGTDGILPGAAIWAEADATFSSSVNTTDLVFATAISETARASANARMRLLSTGSLHVSSGAVNDCYFRIEADTGNNGSEGYNPRLEFAQDGGILESAIGHGLGVTGLDGNQNELCIANSVTDGGIALAVGSTHGYSNASIAMYIKIGGNVGIGTTDPDYTLHVSTDLADNYAAKIENLNADATDGSGGLWVRGGSDDATNAAYSPYALLIQEADGSAGDENLFYVRQDGAYYHKGSSISDRRLKKDINNCTYGLSELNQLLPKEFRYEENKEDAPLHHGFIAQDVETVMPKLVTGDSSEELEGHMTLDYKGISAVLVKAVQELSAKVTALEAQIS